MNFHSWLNVLDLAANAKNDVILGAIVLQIVLKAAHYVYSRAVAVTIVQCDANKCTPSLFERKYVGDVRSVVV
jgi:hypothetical protein